MAKQLKQYISEIEKEIAESLRVGACTYFNLALTLYAERERGNLSSFQAILGNFAVSVELLLKSVVASKLFPLLYEGLTRESLAILLFPERMPAQTLPHQFIGELRNFSQKTIDLNQAISCFFILYPEQKQELGSHLKLLSRIRNVAVHGATPSFQIYHLERLSYIACKLFLYVKRRRLFDRLDIDSEQARKRVESYDLGRVSIVHDKIEKAKSRTKSIQHLWSASDRRDDWGWRYEACPVCKNEAQLSGYTEEQRQEEKSYLFFYKETLECHGCGLFLDDAAQLSLAGVTHREDISDLLEDWYRERSFMEER